MGAGPCSKHDKGAEADRPTAGADLGAARAYRSRRAPNGRSTHADPGVAQLGPGSGAQRPGGRHKRGVVGRTVAVTKHEGVFEADADAVAELDRAAEHVPGGKPDAVMYARRVDPNGVQGAVDR